MAVDWRRPRGTFAVVALATLVAACEGVIGLGAYSEGPPVDGGRDATAQKKDADADHASPGDGSDATGMHDARQDVNARHDAAEGGKACGAAGPCTSLASCGTSTNVCETLTCADGCCGVAYADTSTVCAEGQICNGAGACVQCVTTAQCVPPPCTVAACTTGACTYSAADAGAACTSPGAKVCNGNTAAPQCVECTTAGDCASHPCYTPSCTDTGACSYTAATGGACGTGGTCSAGNCNECNCPSPTKACEVSTCADSTCGTANAGAGTPCGDGGTDKVCNDAGACVPCNVAADCPAPMAGTCNVATCTGGSCGQSPAPPNTTCSANGGSICTTAGQCVACTSSDLTACKAPTPYCGSLGTCVACTADSNCSKSTPYCASGTCVQCTSNSQCGLLGLGSCSNGKCN